MFSAIRTAFLVITSITFSALSFPAQAANVAPTISGTPPTSVFVKFQYRFVPTARDSNGDRLRFSIANKPAWASFDSATGTLAGTPATTGLYSNIVIRVSDGQISRSLPAFSIRVRTNHAPTISGTPANTVVAGSAYSFRPTAADSDGQALKFSIVGKPAWASFSTATGKLYGTPGNTAAGTYSGIRITVTDGKLSATLPGFWITVTKSTATGNRAPTISGAPVTTAQIGRPYAFKPTAYDADGDSLTFKISGKPVWAKFDTSNGTLYGTPTSSNIGVYKNIVIGVERRQSLVVPGPVLDHSQYLHHGVRDTEVDRADAEYGRHGTDRPRGVQGVLRYRFTRLLKVREAGRCRRHFGRDRGADGGHVVFRDEILRHLWRRERV